MNVQTRKIRWCGCSDLALTALGFLLAYTQPACSQTKPESDKSAAITQALTEVVNQGQAPGMVAAIISGKGIIAIGSAGVRKVGSDIPFACNDLVHLGSCTKAMTSTMIATLVAEGKLNWEMKLVEALPELKKSFHPDFQDITLWQLLTHRAGLPSNPTDWDAYNTKEIKERRLAILKDNLSSATSVKQGEFNYSNFGYMIAACMAEKVTGLSWESLMKQRLFNPLGMSSAGFGVPGTPGLIDQPWGHQRFGGRWQPSNDYDAEALGPAGEIRCTVADWSKFLAIQLGNKNSILEQKYLDKLVEPVGFYAAGWGVIEDLPWAQGRVLTHNGSNGIWYATVLVATRLDRAYVVVTNSRDFTNTEDLCSKMINKLIKINQTNN
ncbi:MAG: serine hydrolase [Bacteroidetes bacterium]|nr:serine hydrolase [Bacteroidota bacterium]